MFDDHLSSSTMYRVKSELLFLSHALFFVVSILCTTVRTMYFLFPVEEIKFSKECSRNQTEKLRNYCLECFSRTSCLPIRQTSKTWVSFWDNLSPYGKIISPREYFFQFNLSAHQEDCSTWFFFQTTVRITNCFYRLLENSLTQFVLIFHLCMDFGVPTGSVHFLS